MKPAPDACPTPWKAYRITDPETAARTAAAFSPLFGKLLEAYLCPCGLYHLRDEEKRKRREYRDRRRRDRAAPPAGQEAEQQP